jgi:IS1 family transposase
MSRPTLTADSLTELGPETIRDLSRETLEKLMLQIIDLVFYQANLLKQNSTNSSRPPSSDSPYDRSTERGKDLPPAEADDQAAADQKDDNGTDGGGDSGTTMSGAGTGKKPPAKRPGKRPGMQGHWRSQPLVVEGEVEHAPDSCGQCGAGLGIGHRGRMVSAHLVCELDRDPQGIRISCRKHCYFAARCGCGHETVARPGRGANSESDGRKRALVLTEQCMVGPMLATFIAALALRFRLSRQKVREFLRDWMGLDLGVATINRCIHEIGLACEPVVEELIEEVRAADIVHLDETPWYQAGTFLWMWVAVTQTIVVFRIGSRAKTELTALIGEAFMGWLVTDGYGAYRDHPRRQRCLAHLIRKAVALATGYYRKGSAFGRDLTRDLRSLIQAVAEGASDDRTKRLLARIKSGCKRNQHEVEVKVRALAREILNDWDAVIAFVSDPNLPPTNNDAERALRHVVIARRLSFGTRTNEGSRFYAAALSVVESCRKRSADVWGYTCELLKTARAGLPHPPMPASIVAPSALPLAA